jgi:hypothetical protein
MDFDEDTQAGAVIATSFGAHPLSQPVRQLTRF